MTVDRVPVVQRQFGRAATEYASSTTHARGESLARLVELTQPEPDWHVLDVATGAGHTAAAFAPHVTQVVASDVTPEMLAQTTRLARERMLRNVTTVNAEATALPFPDRSFDLVTCRLAAHHFPALSTFISEVKRVLKPGGAFALVDNIAPDGDQLQGFTCEEISAAGDAYNAFERLRDCSHACAIQAKQWIVLLTAADFTIRAQEQITKDLDFATWTARMRCAPQTIALLESLLTSGPDALRAFLRPRRDGKGGLRFSLQELLLIAHTAR